MTENARSSAAHPATALLPPVLASPPVLPVPPPGYAEAVSLAFGELVALGRSAGLEWSDPAAPLGSHAVDTSSSAPRAATAAALLVTLFPLVNRAPYVVCFDVHDLYACQKSPGCMQNEKVLGPMGAA
ncbi:hypothetical protein OG625_01195 [Streptomyces sp. NBC_01351]|uniref:hypothetical protein n=1 Tax=Streptomyces sp. NBC_01351 TaxID=2903833 RepID=UPI002E36CCA6|nr:hypothetical protein [Streptomyces sp. NBC_01351]